MKFVTIYNTNIYYYDNGCNVEDWLKQGYLYGEANSRVVQSIKKEGMILDCGAHIGTFALPLAIKGEDVVCIEAAHMNIECLGKTFSDFANVSIESAILSDRIQPCGFSRESGPFGWIQSDGELLSTTIDNIMHNYKKSVGAIKLDIEGGEIEALSGASETIKKWRPPMLIEVNGFCLMQSGRRCEDLLKKISLFGYTIYLRFSSSGIQRVDPDKIFPWGNADVICIPDEDVQNYKWTNYAITLSDLELLDRAKTVKSVSNADLASYFSFIGV